MKNFGSYSSIADVQRGLAATGEAVNAAIGSAAAISMAIGGPWGYVIGGCLTGISFAVGGLLGQKNIDDFVAGLTPAVISNVATQAKVSSSAVASYIGASQIRNTLVYAHDEGTANKYDKDTNLELGGQYKSGWFRTTWYYVNKTRLANVIAGAIAGMIKDGVIVDTTAKESIDKAAMQAGVAKLGLGLLVLVVVGILVTKGVQNRRNNENSHSL